ncbi:hydroxymethylglutaryl-CoA lyase [Planococcus dechangensis]|uniref:Hydroxymethylglutaryl-CoA lyase n=2 Tax=Planococcus dechangensis TaxID=1176255 RepID=A0ABV9MF02_9BACL
MDKVIMTDVTGRDGFQMEKEWIQTEDKVRIIDRIIASGIPRIEATSFVSPKAVPQMRDAKEVIGAIKRENIEVIALVPNVKGAELALEAGVDEVNYVLSISETHNLKNVKKTVDESIAGVKEIQKLMDSSRITVSLATAFGCPFEGLYNVDKILGNIETLTEAGLNRFTIADTTGMANPSQMTEFIAAITEKYPDHYFGLHLHNTRGMGLANLYAAYQAGLRHFDAALGGIGGCPFAPGASGNVCLEDVVHMFQFMGVPIDGELPQLINTALDMEKLLGRQLPGQVMKAGQSDKTHVA